jgi:hypothetical protein
VEEMLLLLKSFEASQVLYLIIGGFAVNRYGYGRATGDIDIYLKDTPENRANLIQALAQMGYGQFDMLMRVPIIAGYCEIMMDDGIYADLMTEIPGLDKDMLMNITKWLLWIKWTAMSFVFYIIIISS